VALSLPLAQLGAKLSRQMQVGAFFADFLCRELNLVVEVDGFSHDLRTECDAARDRWFAGEGYRVLRFTNEGVLRNVDGVVEAIGEEIGRLRAGLAHP
jgi:very-short-patch-repair endonuclease